MSKKSLKMSLIAKSPTGRMRFSCWCSYCKLNKQKKSTKTANFDQNFSRNCLYMGMLHRNPSQKARGGLRAYSRCSLTALRPPLAF